MARQFKNKNFLCLFGPPPSPLVCIVYLHYALMRPPQGQKYLLNHKDQFFSFWYQPCNSLEDNIPFSIL